MSCYRFELNTLLTDEAHLGMTGERGAKTIIVIAVAEETASGETATGIVWSGRIGTEIEGTRTEGTIAMLARAIGMPTGRGMMTGTGRGIETAIEIDGETTATMTTAGLPKGMIGQTGVKTEDMIRATAIAGNCIRVNINAQQRMTTSMLYSRRNG